MPTKADPSLVGRCRRKLHEPTFFRSQTQTSAPLTLKRGRTVDKVSKRHEVSPYGLWKGRQKGSPQSNYRPGASAGGPETVARPFDITLCVKGLTEVLRREMLRHDLLRAPQRGTRRGPMRIP